MKTLSRRHALFVSLAALTSAAAGAATPDIYPQRSVRIVVPYAAAGASDLVARKLAVELGKTWSQPVVIDNRAGANTIIGTDVVAKSPADGYTLLLTSNAYVINPSLYERLPYDWQKDLLPITKVADIPQVLVTHAGYAAQSFKQLIQLAKDKPDYVTYGTSGIGGPGHLAAALLDDLAGVKLRQVPYKGAAPALNDLLAGQVALMFNGIPATLPQIKAGKLVPLAVASKQRSSMLPNVPTVAELGYPGYEASTWVGLYAPATTPPAIVSTVHKAISAILATAEMQSWLNSQGLTPVGNTPQQFVSDSNAEWKRWGDLIRKNGIRPE
jgi:tripartite-type tricarboxylate transporter receptor subunit TctC